MTLQQQELIPCRCGCGNTRPKYDNQGRVMRFISGHQLTKGKRLSEEHRRKIGISELGEENHQWKGDNVGYRPLHRWVRSRLLKPQLCQSCRLVPPYDLVNITGVYNREFSNWSYYCRKCHLISDGRMMKNLKQYSERSLL